MAGNGAPSKNETHRPDLGVDSGRHRTYTSEFGAEARLDSAGSTCLVAKEIVARGMYDCVMERAKQMAHQMQVRGQASRQNRGTLDAMRRQPSCHHVLLFLNGGRGGMRIAVRASSVPRFWHAACCLAHLVRHSFSTLHAGNTSRVPRSPLPPSNWFLTGGIQAGFRPKLPTRSHGRLRALTVKHPSPKVKGTNS